MTKRYEIEAIHEPNGEGYGWDKCDETIATHWAVRVMTGEAVIECFATRAEAEAYVATDPENLSDPATGGSSCDGIAFFAAEACQPHRGPH